MKLYNKITNWENVAIIRPEFDNRLTDMVDVFDLRPRDIFNTNVYALKLASGTAVEVKRNLAFSKVDGDKFTDAYIRAWYYFERANIMNEYTSLCELDEGDEEDAAAMKIIDARYNHIIGAMNQFKTLDGIPETVVHFVRAGRKAPADSYNFDAKLFSDVVNALKKTDGEEVAENKPRGLHALRESLKPFCKALWVPTKDGTVGQYVYNPNARLTEDIFRIYLREYAHNDKTGKIERKKASAAELAASIVLACFFELQRKDEEKRKAEEAPAAPKKPAPKKTEEAPAKEEAPTA